MPRRTTPPPPPRRRRPWRAAGAVAATLAAVAAAVFGLRHLGDEALRRVGPRDRYRTPFADVSCDAPPGLDRPAFLAEVRYVGGLPDTVNVLDPADRDRLAAGFARHPWVDAVDGVTAEPGGAVRIELRFRRPVLAVTTTDGDTRLLDGGGVLLPAAPRPPGVAELVGPVPPPRVAAGEVWRDGVVERAVELVAAYGPRRLERAPAGWTLTLPDGKALAVGR